MLGKDGRYYDRSFDFDRDGKLSAYEYEVMNDVVFGHHDEPEIDDDDDDDLSFELSMAGIDKSDLEYMDEDEIKETLEEAGIDIDDYDFD